MELLRVKNPLSPKEIAVELDISENAARGLVRRTAHEGLIQKVGYGQYGPISKSPEYNVITPREKPPEIIGKTPHTVEGQRLGDLHGVSDVTINPQATHQDSEESMEVPLNGGLSTVRIPEYVDVIMFGQVVARVKMSTVVPGMVQRVDVTKSVLNSNMPLKNEEPPAHGEPRA